MKPAHFGSGGKTVYDEKVRKASEIEGKRISITYQGGTGHRQLPLIVILISPPRLKKICRFPWSLRSSHILPWVGCDSRSFFLLFPALPIFFLRNKSLRSTPFRKRGCNRPGGFSFLLLQFFFFVVVEKFGLMIDV